MENEYDDLTIEELLRDVDVLGNPGWYWTLVGAAVMLSLSVATVVWRLSRGLRGIKA